METGGFICVHCGNKVSELYHTYSPTVLKISHCVHCSNITDQYIEYDIVLIFLDLFLQRLRAYRHVLFNMNIQKTWRLAIMFILCDSYYRWVKSRSSTEKTVDIYDLEWHFYVSVLQSCFETVLIVLLCSTVTKMVTKSSMNIWTLMNFFSISFYGNVLSLLAVVWEQQNNIFFQCLTQMFLFVSQIQVLRALTNGSVFQIMPLVFTCSLMAKILTLSMFSNNA